MQKNIMDFEHPTQGGNLRPQYTTWDKNSYR